MRAIVLNKTCRADELKVTDVKMPESGENRVIIKVLAFGINRSEIILRSREADESYINTPIIPGIECIGEIADKSNSEFETGERVIALMGGMGRSFDGSYAEYVSVPIKNVFHINKRAVNEFSVKELAAIPESFYTAYGSLKYGLKLNKNDTLLVRGGTSACGIAAIQLGKGIGCKIAATTRKRERAGFLKNIGADHVAAGNESIDCDVNKVLDLIGPVSLADSLKTVQKGGIVCSTGILGGKICIENFDPIKDIPNGVFLSSFFSNYPNQHDIDKIFDIITENNIKPVIAASLRLEEVCKAHELMEKGSVTGKIVIEV